MFLLGLIFAITWIEAFIRYIADTFSLSHNNQPKVKAAFLMGCYHDPALTQILWMGLFDWLPWFITNFRAGFSFLKFIIIISNGNILEFLLWKHYHSWCHFCKGKLMRWQMHSSWRNNWKPRFTASALLFLGQKNTPSRWCFSDLMFVEVICI